MYKYLQDALTEFSYWLPSTSLIIAVPHIPQKAPSSLNVI